MCPSVAVLGGGSGSGGGSGDGSGDGNGNGADGNGNGENANGDGGNAGSCGPGGPGACTNCGHNVAAGDPVDVVSGKVFTIPSVDLELPGTFGLTVLRSYGADNRRADVGIGYGWTHSLAWRLEEHRDHALIRAGDGTRTVIPLPRPGDQLRAGAWGILRIGELYVIRPGNEFIHYFERDPGTSHFRLAFVRYRNRGAISLQYEPSPRGGSALARVIDSVGRVILFERTPEGRTSSITCPDSRGNAIVFARYAYDSEGNLVSAAEADGSVTSYAYDDEHKLVRLEYPNRLVFHFRYDEQGRCTETWGDGPDLAATLASDVPQQLVDGSPARGIYHCRLDFGPDGMSEVADSMRRRRFFSGPGDSIAKAVDPLGGVTTREFDPLGRVIRQTDPGGNTWSYAHDDLDQVIREVDPEGHEVKLRRDGAGRVIELVDAAGGVVKVARDSSGEITSIEDPTGAIKRFVRDSRGLVLECHDHRGARLVFEYDAHANCILKSTARGGAARAAYDAWGRLVADTDPLGFTRSFTYSNGGKLLSERDRTGAVRSFQYDVMGNCTSVTEADGTTTAWEYGGLSWCRLERTADGAETKLEYDREGYVTRLVNARGQKYELGRNGLGHITREVTFDGQVIRFGYDRLGRVTSYDEGAGKHEIVRDKVGNVLAHTAPDGSARTFQYNARGELVRATQGKNAFAFSLDGVGRVEREDVTIHDRAYFVESELDSAGDRVGLSTSLGHRLRLERDASGQVRAVADKQGDVLGVERNLLGIAIREALGGGAQILDRYDPARRLRRREVVPPGPTFDEEGKPEWIGGARPGVTDYQFDYTATHELVSVRAAAGGGSGQVESVDYEYDLVRHLKKARRKAIVEELRADPNGNMHEVGTNASRRVYDEGDKLVALDRPGGATTEYRYDALGRLVEERTTNPPASADGKPQTTSKKLTWDGFGMLKAVKLPDGTTVSYDYDAFARLVARTVSRPGKKAETRHFVWDLANMLHEVALPRDAATQGPPPSYRAYLFLDNDDVRPRGHRDVADGQEKPWRYYVWDPLGTPEEIIDGAGRRLAKLERTAYGLTTIVGGEGTPFRFPGQLADSETGLHYNRFRTYDPAIGRYLSPDPLALQAGTNAYAYARNPVGWSDPLGLHDLTHSSDDPGFVATQGRTVSRGPMAGAGPFYRSGRGPNMPAQLACVRGMDDRTHTEQQFAHDLISQRGNQGGVGTTHNLGGQFPPCPTCHGAMMRAASETGATINYTWTQNGETQTIQYTGSGARATSGSLATRLAGDGTTRGVYDHQLTGGWQGLNRPGDPGQTYTSDSRQYWGFSSGPGCEAEYQDMRDACQAGTPFNPSTPTARRPSPATPGPR